MYFRMVDGRIYRGNNFTEVVQDMRVDKLRRTRSRARYRITTAERVAQIYNVTIDPSTDKNFIKSLERAGLMEEIEK